MSDKRLTEHNGNGSWSLKGMEWDVFRAGQPITREMYEKLYGALCKLKDYEPSMDPKRKRRCSGVGRSISVKSILHDKIDRTCFLCMLLHGDDSYKAVLEEHHVFFGRALRKLSEKHGMKVYLCIFHHRTGKEAVHQNGRINKMVQAYAQRTFEKKWPEKDFYGIFGKNYILEEEIGSEIEENVENTGSVAGFTLITDGIEGMGRKWDTDTYTANC